jgi:hypothetical protein
LGDLNDRNVGRHAALGATQLSALGAERRVHLRPNEVDLLPDPRNAKDEEMASVSGGG